MRIFNFLELNFFYIVFCPRIKFFGADLRCGDESCSSTVARTEPARLAFQWQSQFVSKKDKLYYVSNQIIHFSVQEVIVMLCENIVHIPYWVYDPPNPKARCGVMHKNPFKEMGWVPLTGILCWEVNKVLWTTLLNSNLIIEKFHRFPSHVELGSSVRMWRFPLESSSALKFCYIFKVSSELLIFHLPYSFILQCWFVLFVSL